MHQKGRAGILQQLQIGLLASIATLAVAQATGIDFQVIHLPRLRYPEGQYVAIRTSEAWHKLWRDSFTDPNVPPPAKIDLKHFILLIANTGVKPSSGYMNIFESVQTAPASMSGPPSSKMATTVHVIEMGPGNCPVMTALMSSVSYALIPQTTNEIRFLVTKANNNCTSPVVPPFIK